MWIANHQEAELFSYKYVETLKDSARIESYIPILTDPELLIYGGGTVSVRQKTDYSSPDKVKEVNSRSRYVYILPGKNAPDMQQNVNIFGESGVIPQMKVYYRTLEEVYRSSVAIGDKVFAIKIKSGGKEYTNYVFCRPGSNKVIFDKIFYGVKSQMDGKRRVVLF